MQVDYQLSKSNAQLSAARKVWTSVFVNELGEVNPEKPWGSEPGAQIFLARDNKITIAAAQLTPITPKVMQIEHVAVLQTHRGNQIGQGLIKAMTEAACVQHIEKVRLSARVEAQTFYQRLGFQAVGEEFEEFGSPHILMEQSLVGSSY
jgi:predicted GNAT family N-acyltransferase